LVAIVSNVGGFGQVDVEELGVELLRVGGEQSLRFSRDGRCWCRHCSALSAIADTAAVNAAVPPAELRERCLGLRGDRCRR
jgi:hypothetical protein